MTDNNVLEFKRRPYRTAESTIDAFWYMVKLGDEDRLKAWLADHMRDAPTLRKLYEERQNVSA